MAMMGVFSEKDYTFIEGQLVLAKMSHLPVADKVCLVEKVYSSQKLDWTSGNGIEREQVPP